VPALARALGTLGVSTEVVAAETSLSDSHRRHRRYLRLLSNAGFRDRLKQRSRPDTLIHDNGVWLPSNHHAAAAARRFRIPFVVSPRGMLTPWAMSAGAWKKRLAWTAYQKRDVRSAALLHATSDQEAEEFRRLGLRNPIAIIPNGIDSPADSNLRFPLSTFGESDSRSAPRTLLFLSRVHRKKGLLDLVHAWARLRAPSPLAPSSALPAPCSNWRVVIAGPDEDGHQRQLEAAAAAAGVRDDFTFIGPVDDHAKWALYRSADLFVLPSYSENFGIVIGEALACGVPVITTRATPWREIEQHRCGWWIEPGAETLAAALREALSLSANELAQMGQRGRVLIQRSYSWTAAAQQMLAAYEWLLGRRAKPDCIHL
jgi:glycosyltransferase involved in cell wall biosynthesis